MARITLKFEDFKAYAEQTAKAMKKAYRLEVAIARKAKLEAEVASRKAKAAERAAKAAEISASLAELEDRIADAEKAEAKAAAKAAKADAYTKTKVAKTFAQAKAAVKDLIGDPIMGSYTRNNFKGIYPSEIMAKERFGALEKAQEELKKLYLELAKGYEVELEDGTAVAADKLLVGLAAVKAEEVSDYFYDHPELRGEKLRIQSQEAFEALQAAILEAAKAEGLEMAKEVEKVQLWTRSQYSFHASVTNGAGYKEDNFLKRVERLFPEEAKNASFVEAFRWALPVEVYQTWAARERRINQKIYSEELLEKRMQSARDSWLDQRIFSEAAKATPQEEAEAAVKRAAARLLSSSAQGTAPKDENGVAIQTLKVSEDLENVSIEDIISEVQLAIASGELTYAKVIANFWELQLQGVLLAACKGDNKQAERLLGDDGSAEFANAYLEKRKTQIVLDELIKTSKLTALRGKFACLNPWIQSSNEFKITFKEDGVSKEATIRGLKAFIIALRADKKGLMTSTIAAALNKGILEDILEDIGEAYGLNGILCHMTKNECLRIKNALISNKSTRRALVALEGKSVELYDIKSGESKRWMGFYETLLNSCIPAAVAEFNYELEATKAQLAEVASYKLPEELDAELLQLAKEETLDRDLQKAYNLANELMKLSAEVEPLAKLAAELKAAERKARIEACLLNEEDLSEEVLEEEIIEEYDYSSAEGWEY